MPSNNKTNIVRPMDATIRFTKSQWWQILMNQECTYWGREDLEPLGSFPTEPDPNVNVVCAMCGDVVIKDDCIRGFWEYDQDEPAWFCSSCIE